MNTSNISITEELLTGDTSREEDLAQLSGEIISSITNDTRITIPSSVHPYITEIIIHPWGDGLYTFFFLQKGQKYQHEATEMSTSIQSLCSEYAEIASYIGKYLKKRTTAINNLNKIKERTGRPGDDLVQLSVRIDRSSIEKLSRVQKTNNIKNTSEVIRYIINQFTA